MNARPTPMSDLNHGVFIEYMACIVDITTCNENAVLPTRGSPGAAGYDLCSVEGVTIPPGERRLVNTGLRMRIPGGLYGRIAPRSGLSVRKCIDVGAGVIDSDYRGEVRVLLINNGADVVTLLTGTRIAQLVFEKIAHPTLKLRGEEEFDKKDTTERGSGGFGSTGLSKLHPA